MKVHLLSVGEPALGLAEKQEGSKPWKHPPLGDFSGEITGCEALSLAITKVPVVKHVKHLLNEVHTSLWGDTFGMANIVSTFLKGGAPGWLGDLEPHSIDSWNTFAKIFVESFATTRDKDELKESLKHVRMAKGEKLRDFLE